MVGLYAARDGSLRTGDVQEVEVLMRQRGSAQLWWGGGLGVVAEAFVGERGRVGAETETLTALWELCEGFLHDRGVATVWTPARDPVADAAGSKSFLAGRGYRPLRRGAVGMTLV